MTDTRAPCRVGTKGVVTGLGSRFDGPQADGAPTEAPEQRECYVPGWQEVGIIRHAEGLPQKPWARGGRAGQMTETQLRSSWLKREV